jgi:hypothetical protein
MSPYRQIRQIFLARRLGVAGLHLYGQAKADGGMNTRKAALMSYEERRSYIDKKLGDPKIQELRPSDPEFLRPLHDLMAEGFDYNEIFDYIFPPQPEVIQ